MEAAVFRALLHFIYSDTLPSYMEDPTTTESSSNSMAQHLLVAADRYGLERLRLVCEYKLCRNIGVNTVANTLALAEQHRCRRLKAACLNFIASPGTLAAVIETDGFEHLRLSCPLVIKELLEKLAKVTVDFAAGSTGQGKACRKSLIHDPRKKKKGVAIVGKDSDFEERLTSSNVRDERMTPSQREVLGLSFPIHEDDKSKHVSFMFCSEYQHMVPPFLLQDPLTDVADIGVSSFNEAFPTRQEDENIDVRSDSGAGCSRNEIPIVAKSFLTDRIIDIVKTFDRRQFKSAQEEVSKYCQCLSALGFDTSELERRIKPIFDHAEVIEELVSSPNFVPFVRVMDAGDNLALSRRKLASHMATKDSLLQATRNVSLQLQQTREKIKELEESISHLKSTEAELSLQLEVADDSLKKLQPSQEELQQDVVNAEKEHAAATEVYNDSKESTGLRELIELFEERRQIFEI
uniref:Uncharacterized protein n=1 Tax=Ananas comosus var. bracteatus TaxID=296719 RepID=A0A6V7P5A4_ANACO|nr:unnamed protein product [Ananas comosus var. bracteatus]